MLTVMVSAATKSSLPRARVRMWRLAAVAASALGDEAEADLLVDHGVVVGEGGEIAVASEIAARVSDVGDDGGVEAEGAEDQGGGHVRSAGKDGAAGIGVARVGAVGSGVSLVEDGVVGLLHQAGEKGDVHDALGNLAEASLDGLDGEAGCDFAALLSADSVGQGEEPSLGVDLRGRGGKNVAEEVLVVVARQAGIGEFSEFEIEHRRPAGWSVGCAKGRGGAS